MLFLYGGIMTNAELKKSTRYMMNTGIFHSEAQAMDILVASLKALRDRLPKVEAFDLGMQLPEVLRPVYFNDWNKDQRQFESVNKSDFMAEVEYHLKGYEDHDITDLVPAALNSILNFIDQREASHLKHAVPVSMRDIFVDRQAM